MAQTALKPPFLRRFIECIERSLQPFRDSIFIYQVNLSCLGHFYNIYGVSMTCALAIFCCCTVQFVSDLVGNPEDRFSYDEANVVTF